MGAALDLALSAHSRVFIQVRDDITALVEEVNRSYEEQEAMAGECVRIHSQLTSSGSAGESLSCCGQKGADGEQVRTRESIPERMYAPLKKQKWKVRACIFEQRPILLMRGCPVYDFVDTFCWAPVTDLTWGSLMDIAPASKGTLLTS